LPAAPLLFPTGGDGRDSESRASAAGHSNEGNHPPGAVAISAPGKKLRGVAKCAAANQLDAVGTNARRRELIPIFHSQIEFACLGHSKLPRDVRADLITAGTDSWTDGRKNILRLRPKILAHASERRRDDTGGGPPPPRVNRRHGSRFEIHQ
jgi:hypothetical protein